MMKRRMQMMMTLMMALTTIGLASCDEVESIFGSEEEAPAIRILGFKMVEIPAEMTDEEAVALAANERGNRITANALPFYFPTSDSVDLPFTALLANRIILTPPSRSNPGACRIVGGHSSSRLPVAGRPHALTIDAIGAGVAGSATSTGSWEVMLGEDLLLQGNSSRGDHLDFHLDTYNDRTTYATGSFVCIVRNDRDRNDTRRWILFDGEFALASR